MYPVHIIADHRRFFQSRDAYAPAEPGLVRGVEAKSADYLHGLFALGEKALFQQGQDIRLLFHCPSGEELEMMFAVAGLSAHPEDLQKVSLASQAQASMAESHFAPVPEESSVAPVSEERASPAHAPALPDELLRERQAAARRVVEQLSAAQGREMSEEPSVSEEERSLQERLNVAMREYEESTGSSRPVSPASSVATATPKVASFAARGAYGITSSPGVKSLRARHRR